MGILDDYEQAVTAIRSQQAEASLPIDTGRGGGSGRAVWEVARPPARRTAALPCVCGSAINARTRSTSPAPGSPPRRRW
jgi:hypothetical protein